MMVGSGAVGPLPLLVARAQAGDREALDVLLRMLQEPLFAFVRGIVRDDHLARDVLQEVLWMICRRLPALREPRWLRAWAYRIAAREAVRCVRRERRDVLTDWDESNDVPVEIDDAPHDDLLRALPRLVDEISPASGIVLRLHYLDGLTHREIAEALEIAPGTVKSRLAYGLTALRKRLGVRESGATR